MDIYYELFYSLEASSYLPCGGRGGSVLMRERMAIHGSSPVLAARSPELNFSQKCQCADIDGNSYHHHQGPVDRLEVLRY